VPELLPGDAHTARVGESHLRHIHTLSLTPGTGIRVPLTRRVIGPI
jgi:hypothetical protein